MLNHRLELSLSERHRSLCNEKQQQLLAEAITEYVGHPVLLSFSFISQDTPVETQALKKDTIIKKEVTADISKDSNLQQLLEMFDADIHKTTNKKG
jgi:hypothetical protein